MSVEVLRTATVLYAASAVSYIFFFVRPHRVRAVRMGFALVAGAFLVHAVAISLACRESGGTQFFALRGGLGMLAFVGAGLFLVLEWLYPLPAVGAFVLPLVVIAALPGLFGLGSSQTGVLPSVVRLPALKVHVSTAIGGVALFAIAFGVAAMYLLQEREVKGKHFGVLFSRLPSLESLDRLNQSLVRTGFAVWSVALVTGAMVAKNAWGSFWMWDPQQVTALLVWLLYGAMVELCHMGMHGRRYALLTLAGFALLMTSMIALGTVPNVTRHGGNFQ
ncbi:MAG TPA: cytochrome c biogenesis protein CcsA [Anaeromyxobacteraceae bacterium]|nr:cytochrome c biogenesis protein CcsA [Anaeromyxobacteraceae bacterium]